MQIRELAFATVASLGASYLLAPLAGITSAEGLGVSLAITAGLAYLGSFLGK